MKWDLEKIEFKDEKRFLSNMWESAILFEGSSYLKKLFPEIIFDGLLYPSSEHLYQSLKSTDSRWHDLIREIEKPTHTKREAKKLSASDGGLFGDEFFIRSDWHDIKVRIMTLIIFLKFSQNKQLSEMLLSLGDEKIVERNCWGDRFWGTVDDEGENHLGIILMKMRSFLADGDLKRYFS